MQRLGWFDLLLVLVVVDRLADAFPTQSITTARSSSTCPRTVPYSSALWGEGGADNSPLSPEDRPTSYPWIPQSGNPSVPSPAAAAPQPLYPPSNTNPVRPQQQQQQQASSNKYLYAPSSSSSQPQPPRDPWTGFPLSVYENPTVQPPSPRPGSSPYPGDNDDWQRDFQHLQDQVSQLGSDLSFFSSQLGGRSSSLSSSSSESPFSSWEQSIRNQLDKVKDAQLMVGRQVQQSIQDIRESVSVQDSKLSYLYQQSKEQTQRMTNLSQIVTTTIDDQQSRMSQLPTSKDVDERLRALEARLTQQQLDLVQQGANSRWDPILQAMETKLQEQAELLNQALLDPSNNARLSVVETKLDQMQDELFEVMMTSRQPNIRLEALEDRVLLREQQQQQQQTNKDNIDPRLTALEAKMKLQEEQIREATAALSDARITAMRAKLIEQQEQLEQGMSTTPTTSSSSTRQQPQQQPKDDTNKGWAPFGQWNARPEVTKQERDQGFGAGFPPFRAPSPSTDLPTSFESYQSTSPLRDDNNGADLPPPPPVSSYQSEPPPPQDDPVGSRRVRRPVNTSPPRKPMSDFRAYQPPSSPPPPTTGSTSRSGGGGGGGFRGNPFGRAGGVTIATEDDQKPVDMGIPRKAIAESARPDRRNRFTPPPPNNNNRAPGPFSDQDLWRRDALDPDSAPTSRRAAKITSDQDRWDSTTAPNPDAIPRPPPPPVVDPRWSSFNNGVGSQSPPPSKRGFSGGVTSDQGRLSSSARVARDIDDLKATMAASPPASHIRPRQQSTGTTAPTQSYYQSTNDDDDMFMKDHVLSEYMEWCAAYDREPSEYRFQNFYANYAEMGATRQFPVLDEFADYSKEELSKVGRR